MDFHFLDDFWHQNIFNEQVFYNIMRYYKSKYKDYIHAYTNYDRLHVIHEMLIIILIEMMKLHNIDMQSLNFMSIM